MDFLQFEKACDIKKIEYAKNEPMKYHTTFKIGGPADYLVSVCSKEQLKEVIALAKQCGIPFMVLGKGSNLLVSDKGVEGIVITLSGMDEITVKGTEIIAGAGASLASVCVKALENGLSGLEFAYGIPGSVGGGLYMNAGAYGGEMSQVTFSAEYVDFDGNSSVIDVNDMLLGYRTSIFKRDNKIITSVNFRLTKGEQSEIKAKMDNFICRRKSKQPLEYPSAGSTFKRPEGYFAGALIEKCGLKGTAIGGAKVSEKHAGFIVNCGNAACDDVLSLVKKVQKTVLESENVKLEPEIIFIGRE